ncbi:hypothetical protein AB0M43_36745 [Longispora sp. NPDC051575]|uniref:hypothetical protein n=1 Tax=Longispora sp. NPDC051575 TaxID=3154943 RepID=UPI00343DF47F
MPEEEKQGEKGFTLPTALAASLALLVAAFAVVGVSGGLLTRAVRNQPEDLAQIFVFGLVVAGVAASVVILGAAVATRWAAFNGVKGIVVVVAVLALTAGAVRAVQVGANSVAEREQPFVSMSLDPKGKDTELSVVTVEVSGAGLRNIDQLLIQVIALTKFRHPDTSARSVCEKNWADPRPSKSGPPANETFRSEWGAVILSERLGPNQDGAVKATVTLPIDIDKYEGICAWAPLPVGPGDTVEDYRSSVAYLNLTTLRVSA